MNGVELARHLEPVAVGQLAVGIAGRAVAAQMNPPAHLKALEGEARQGERQHTDEGDKRGHAARPSFTRSSGAGKSVVERPIPRAAASSSSFGCRHAGI